MARAKWGLVGIGLALLSAAVAGGRPERDPLREPLELIARARASAECLTGAWAGAVENGTATRGSRDLSFSPGDLDEVVATFVATDGSRSSVDRGSVFTRVGLFRAGFERGANACFS